MSGQICYGKVLCGLPQLTDDTKKIIFTNHNIRNTVNLNLSIQMSQPRCSVLTDSSVRFFLVFKNFGFQQVKADRFTRKQEIDNFGFGFLGRFFWFKPRNR